MNLRQRIGTRKAEDEELQLDEDKEDEVRNDLAKSADGKKFFVEGYAYHLPKDFLSRMRRRPNGTVPCRGCGVSLSVHRYSNVAHPVSVEYYKHVFSCPPFLEEADKCEECKRIFVNSKEHSFHCNEVHDKAKKPAWARGRDFKGMNFSLTSENCTYVDIACKGCGKTFAAKMQGKNKTAHISYYIHCIEKCKKYKELGLISPCKTCGKKFLDPRFLRIHESMHEKRSCDAKNVKKGTRTTKKR